MTLNIRFGDADDVDIIIEFVLQAGNGIFEHLFDGLMPLMSAQDVLRLAVTDEHSPLSASNCIIVEEDGQALGCTLFYPAEEYGLPSIASAIVPMSRLDPLRALLASTLPGSLYIHTVAVAPFNQGKGVGRLLVETVRDYAKETGWTSMSCHAWLNNKRALALYRSMGFEAVEEIEVGASRYFPSHSRLALISAKV